MKNPIIILTHNCLRETQKCVASACNQDIDDKAVWVLDNNSNQDTLDWLQSEWETLGFTWFGWESNEGVSFGWNYGLNCIFDISNLDHCLVINNDTVLPPWFYRRLLYFNLPFVTGVSVGSMNEIANEPAETTPTDGPDFSAFLIRKKAWKTIGRFDENMVMYCQDLDYHLRAHRSGIALQNGHIPFFHDRSSTLRSAPVRERRMIELRADADREFFASKWGVNACSKEYESLFSEKTFGIGRGK